MKRYIGAILALALAALLGGCARPADSGELILYGVNTGKSDCMVFCLPNGEILLMDTGLKKTYDQVKALLDKIEVEEIHHLVITHGHKDHIGGLKKLAKDFKIGVIYTNAYDTATYNDEERADIAAACQEWQLVEPVRLEGGQPASQASMQLGNVEATFLAPSRSYTDAEDDNNNSLVLRLTYGNISFLLMGDATSTIESSMLSLYSESQLQADFLKGGRHGKNDANTEAFIQAVSPSQVYLTGNRADDPDSPGADVLARYAAAGSAVYLNEGEHLAVCFRCDGTSLSAGTYLEK